MRIVIDLQSCQGNNHNRRLCQSTISIVKSLIHQANNHEIWLMLNDFNFASISSLQREFIGLISKDRIVVLAVNGPVTECNPHNINRTRIAERIREFYLAGLRPDIVYVPSLFKGFYENVVASIGTLSELTTITALYDIAPLFFRDLYFSNPKYKEFYLRKLEILNKADLLFSASENTKKDALTLLDRSEASIVNISGGFEAAFKPKQIMKVERANLFNRYKIAKPFILCASSPPEVGNNIPNVLQAYSMLVPDLRKKHQLLIIGESLGPKFSQIMNSAKKIGLAENELLLAVNPSNADLINLYNLCELSVFPSLYETFVSRALEAMACGAAVVGSNSACIPEVIGRSDALFEPDKPDSISKSIQNVLTDKDFRQDLREYGLRQSKKFSWENSAKHVLTAFEYLTEKKKGNTRSLAVVKKSKLKLAFFSPLPPEKSGVSDYSCELIPELARYYDITLIVDQPRVESKILLENYPIRNIAWFEANYKHFDRILYQFGNSNFHKQMFELIGDYPGIIVLHDFFLSHAIHWMDATGHTPHLLTESLYYSHGYPALLALDREGVDHVKWTFPCNKTILDQADGIIVHSQHSISLCKEWYGDEMAGKFTKIPQLRATMAEKHREQARSNLGFQTDDFIVCSFGAINPTKLSHRLLTAWLSSSLAKDKRCYLLFVGENESGEYGKALSYNIEVSKLRKNIKITGFVDHTFYEKYLDAADVSVQLRSFSRGETSRSVLDAFANGLALIVNAHGTLDEYPDDILVKIKDKFSDSELISSLEKLRKDSKFRNHLATSAKSYLGQVHNPAIIGKTYFRAIEKFWRSGENNRYKNLINSLAFFLSSKDSSEKDLLATSEVIARNSHQIRQRQLFVDVSIIINHDRKTGIERVTRSVLLQLLNNPPEEFRIEPVYYGNGSFWYARRFTTELLGIKAKGLSDEIIDAQKHDVFLGLDWNPVNISSSDKMLRQLTSIGVDLFFIVHDILAVSHPEYFPANNSVHVDTWLKVISEVSTGLICVSRSTANELTKWIEEYSPIRLSPLRIGYFYNGSDIEAGISTPGIPDGAERFLNKIKIIPSFLMVGTIEPRKGYAQALAAFDILWSKNIEINLVIVGKEGWKELNLSDRKRNMAIVGRIKGHSLFGKHLFWLDGISDEYLKKIYAASTCLLQASEAEGFGLPIIEAAKEKLPVLARDIPVFREIAGNHAFYFSGKQPEDLANAIEEWFVLFNKGDHPNSIEIHHNSWEESTNMLLGNVLNSKWDSTLVTTIPGRSPSTEISYGIDVTKKLQIECNIDGNLYLFTDKGFSPSEGDHTWTDGKIAILKFNLANSDLIETDLIVSMVLHGFTYFAPYQPVVIFANSHKVFTENIGGEYSKFTFIIPGEDICGQDALEIKFEIDGASSSPIDTRVLGLSFRNITVEPSR